MTRFDEYFDGYTPEYELVFSSGWSSWEESGWIFIFEKDGRYFSMGGGDNEDGSVRKCKIPDDLCELTQEEALKDMLDWAEDENTDYFGCIEICARDGEGLYAVCSPGYTEWYAHRENPPQSSGPHTMARAAFAAVGYPPVPPMPRVTKPEPRTRVIDLDS